MADVVIVLTTVPSGELGAAMATALVDERLAACVHVHPPMLSTYRWNGAVSRDEERQLVIKTTRARLGEVEARVRALHPYDLPEWLVLAVSEGSPGYLDWVRRETARATIDPAS